MVKQNEMHAVKKIKTVEPLDDSIMCINVQILMMKGVSISN